MIKLSLIVKLFSVNYMITVNFVTMTIILITKTL